MRVASLPSVIALAIAIVAISSSAPLIAFAAAPALAIAFWRNAAAVAVLAPVALVRRPNEFTWKAGGVSVLSGLCLAAHFATWVPSAQLTSVAMSVALVSTTPVWAALISAARGIRVPASTWAGIAVAVAGVALATGADPDASPRALLGDALALVGGVAAAGYTLLGERARATIATTTYTSVCYSACALVLLLTCLVAGADLVGFDGRTWLAIAAMTIGPQLLGHTLINYALRRISATMVAVLLLLEVPGALVIAWLLLGQLPEARTLPGIAVLLAGVAIVLLGTRRQPGQPTNGGTAISPEAIGTT
ncbi:DMT family transporter [Dactylosporangium sp. AC04546]|uniref:DMT family transporter n=1 Tax=Dactylosporangium sp. AC04546 TaxID=2862460 RepID=UPI001EE00D23|nr:DMT family transporter [Dactylosporangium sp. AC04546]WVK84615.1 DMT family transporter [Dactylosporangium sp. AC04546]